MTEIKRIPCTVWSRIVGYYRPYTLGAKAMVNPGKRQEIRERLPYEEVRDE